MIVLYVILGILLLLFLLTLIPVRIDVSFRQEFSLTLRYLFLAFPVLPEEEKPKKEAEEAPKEGKEQGSSLQKLKSILKEQGFLGFLKALFQLVKMAASASKKILRAIKVKRFDLYLCLAGAGDAADAAVLYGELSGAVYTACGFLFGLTGCRKKAVTVDLDYQAEENLVDFSARISIRPFTVLAEGISLLIKALPILWKFLKSGGRNKKLERKVIGNERQESE